MDEVSWIAVAMSVIALVKSLYDSYSIRRAKQEEAENTRLTAKDKLDFDSKFITIQTELLITKEKLLIAEKANSESRAHREQIQIELDHCNKQHAEQRQIIEELTLKNHELEIRLAKIESKLSNH